MNLMLKKALKTILASAPRRLQQAYVSAYLKLAPAHISQMIEVERLRQLFEFIDVDCVFDIGANEGQYAQQLRDKVGYEGLIISFEPTPSLIPGLREASRADPSWFIEEVAVSDHDGFLDFNIMASSQMSSIAAPSNQDTDLFREISRPVENIQVRCECLESIFDRIASQHDVQRPFLKMDTQGYDMIIARGAGGVLSRFVGIQSELSIKRLYQTSETMGDSIAYFQKSGFELSSLVPNNQGHFPLLIETDGLFIREDLTHG